MTIPTRIHQVWLGPAPAPVRWTERWRHRYRRWDYRLWAEPDIEEVLPNDLLPAWRHFLEARRWHGAADVGRVAILLREGGVYVDIDSEPVRSFDGAPFMRGSFFAGLEVGTPDRPERVTNGVIGATANHPILQDYARRIAGAEVIEPPWKTVGGGFLTEAILANRDLPGVAILPIRTFYPEDKNGIPAAGNDPIYARQYWATTHGLYAHQGESWRNLQRRRLGEPIVEPPLVRFQRAIATASGIGLATLRRLARRVLPLPVRRSLRGIVRRLQGRGVA